MALFNVQTGELAGIRCKAPNRCSHCRRVSASQTAEMIAMDAEDSAPTLYVVLTCRDLIDRAELRRHLCQLRRSALKLWPALEWFCALEWQARGAIHVNLLVKGVPAADAERFGARLFGVWSRRVTAVREAQYCRPIASARHLGAYVAKLAEYLGKSEQSCPPGWRGHRTSQTRGYFATPVAALRRRAIQSIGWKIARAGFRRGGASKLEAAWLAADRVAERAGDLWVLRDLRRLRSRQSAGRHGRDCGDDCRCKRADGDPSGAVKHDVDRHAAALRFPGSVNWGLQKDGSMTLRS